MPFSCASLFECYKDSSLIISLTIYLVQGTYVKGRHTCNLFLKVQSADELRMLPDNTRLCQLSVPIQTLSDTYCIVS